MCVIQLSVSIKGKYLLYVSWRSLLLLAKLRASNPITSQMYYLHEKLKQSAGRQFESTIVCKHGKDNTVYFAAVLR